MLINYEDGIIITHCDDCGSITETSSSKYIPKYRSDIGEYNNLMILCEECEGLEIFNMNLDLNEYLEDSGLSERESIQRGFVKEMITDLVVNAVE